MGRRITQYWVDCVPWLSGQSRKDNTGIDQVRREVDWYMILSKDISNDRDQSNWLNKDKETIKRINVKKR